MTDIGSKIERAKKLATEAQDGAPETVRQSLRHAVNWLGAALDNQNASLGPEPGTPPPPPLAPERRG